VKNNDQKGQKNYEKSKKSYFIEFTVRYIIRFLVIGISIFPFYFERIFENIICYQIIKGKNDRNAPMDEKSASN
jgi:hypothetical protein